MNPPAVAPCESFACITIEPGGTRHSPSEIPLWPERSQQDCLFWLTENHLCLQLTDGMILDGLWDPYNNIHMGTCADVCAQDYSISRAEQDAHAMESHQRAHRAHEAGFSGRVSCDCVMF